VPVSALTMFERSHPRRGHLELQAPSGSAPAWSRATTGTAREEPNDGRRMGPPQRYQTISTATAGAPGAGGGRHARRDADRVVQVDRKDLKPATFQRALPQVGELAVAVGSPLGFENTVTAGIISGLHREIPGSAQQGIRSLVALIQTDAPISRGNSGGALLNGRGQVVGISVAYIPPEQGAVSIGFAIPAATAVDVVGDLLRTGRATHAYLGIEPAPVTREVAAQLGLDQAAGVLVMEVGDGTPAARAGLQPGDVIVRLDDKPIDTVEDLFGELRQHRPGDRVTLTLIRDGREQQRTATLADNPNG
jgi:serine protease DegQ